MSNNAATCQVELEFQDWKLAQTQHPQWSSTKWLQFMTHATGHWCINLYAHTTLLSAQIAEWYAQIAEWHHWHVHKDLCNSHREPERGFTLFDGQVDQFQVSYLCRQVAMNESSFGQFILVQRRPWLVSSSIHQLSRSIIIYIYIYIYIYICSWKHFDLLSSIPSH